MTAATGAHRIAAFARRNMPAARTRGLLFARACVTPHLPRGGYCAMETPCRRTSPSGRER